MAIENLYNEDGTLNEETLTNEITRIANSISNETINNILESRLSPMETDMTAFKRKANNEINVLKDTIRGLSNSESQGKSDLNDFIKNLKGGK